MNEKLTTAIVQVLVALTGVAILAVLVSRSSNTSGVFGDFGKAISKMFCVALSPITGTNCKSLVEDVHSTITF